VYTLGIKAGRSLVRLPLRLSENLVKFLLSVGNDAAEIEEAPWPAPFLTNTLLRVPGRPWAATPRFPAPWPPFVQAGSTRRGLRAVRRLSLPSRGRSPRPSPFGARSRGTGCSSSARTAGSRPHLPRAHASPFVLCGRRLPAGRRPVKGAA